MPNKQNRPSKAEVQSTKLNKLPVPGEYNAEFSAEEAAEVFKNNKASKRNANNK